MSWNALSWSLYWASVLPSFAAAMQTLLIGVGVITLFAAVVFGLVWSFNAMLGDGGRPDNDNLFIAAQFRGWFWRIVFIPPALFALATFTVFIPDKQTFYLIAASQAGETVATSQDGQDIINEVKAKIQSLLAVPAPAAKP